MYKKHEKEILAIQKTCADRDYKSDASAEKLHNTVSPAVGAAETEEIADHPGLVAGKSRVLLVEDEIIVRNFTIILLKELGYQVESCADGKEALLIVRIATEKGDPFDVVIVDLTINGEISGQHILKRLRNVDPSLKAILSTGHIRNNVMESYKDYGFTALLSKPYNIVELGNLLHDVIGSQVASPVPV